MLFVINENNPIETFFHMHNVPFPLDLIFMDDEFKAVVRYIVLLQFADMDAPVVDGYGEIVMHNG